jgi:hypothetical protein
MNIILGIWLGVSAGIALLARRVGPWKRAIPGALIWPMYPGLILVSRVRYTRRRRIVP